ncbi:MAG TPA: adenylate/guanylate cyclase domain-containing protein, partial [Mycobacteriales bacterium]|nr:adenylate/guanylate cyclase domain-containing protein [Mycobacteriales bacterium]
ALAGDRIVRPGRDIFTLAEVAEQIGCPVEEIRAVWRALGLVLADPELAVASVADVDMLRTAIGMTGVLGREATLGLARVMGSSMARVGDAASTSVRGNMPSMSVAVSGSELETARAFAGIAGAVPALGRVLDTLFRHHLESARMHFERTDSWDVVGQGGIRVGVGFTDLCGFTGLTQRLGMESLSQLLSQFEEIATDVVNDHGGRLVKFIGDAVMYVAVDAATAVSVAEALVEAARVRGLTARAGVTVGTVLALDGDYFGPVVNLAARLVTLAEPGAVLLSDEVAARVQDTRSSISLGPQQIRGFDDPVGVSRLEAVG